MLLQEGHPISFFSENQKGIQLNYFTYDKDLYALVKALQHDSITHLRGQYKLKKRHAKWVDFLEQFHIHALLAMLEIKLLGFGSLKNLYVEDDDFKEAYELCANSSNGGFFRHQGFLFKEKTLCMTRSSIIELLGREAHKDGLMGHLGSKRHMRPCMSISIGLA
ncbi:hypothetical protein CR513_22758, partial [Mucuna pruriens]